MVGAESVTSSCVARSLCGARDELRLVQALLYGKFGLLRYLTQPTAEFGREALPACRALSYVETP